MPLHRFYGQKLLYAGFGLLFPIALTAMVTVIGAHPPVLVPAVASLVLAGTLSVIPNLNVSSDAAAAREQFTRALSAYIDLVALERLAGAGPRQAMESAAGIGDSWPFRRVAEELARSRWSGVPPWDALGRLATDLGLDSLGDLSDIMRLSGEQGAAVYQSLAGTVGRDSQRACDRRARRRQPDRRAAHPARRRPGTHLRRPAHRAGDDPPGGRMTASPAGRTGTRDEMLARVSQNVRRDHLRSLWTPPRGDTMLQFSLVAGLLATRVVGCATCAPIAARSAWSRC